MRSWQPFVRRLERFLHCRVHLSWPRGGDVGKDGRYLGFHKIDCQNFDALDANGVLHGDQSSHRFAIDADLVKRLQVSLYSGAAGWIRTGDGESDGKHCSIIELPGLHLSG